MHSASILCAIVSSWTSLAAGPSTRPASDSAPFLLRIPKIESHAAPDSRFDQPPWTAAACTTGFLRMGSRSLAEQPTWLYVFYDRDRLWLGFRCEGVAGSELKTAADGHDGPVWRDDSVECRLLPAGRAGPRYHVAVNASGTVYDACDDDKEWNPALTVKTARDGRGWSAVLGIPFAELKVSSPAPEVSWVVNFARASSRNEKSCWSPVLKTFDEKDRFGALLFGGSGEGAVRLTRLVPVSIGRNAIALSTAPDSTCDLEGLDGRGRSLSVRRLPREESGVRSFENDDDRVRTIAFAVRDKRGRPVLLAEYPVQSPEVTARLVAMQRKFVDATAALPRFPAAARAKAEPILDAVRPVLNDALAAVADASRRNAETWTRLDADLAKMRQEIDGVSAYAYTLAKFPHAAFAVGWQSPMKKAMIRDHAFDGWFGERATVSLARNEHEAVQLVVMPFGADLRNASVRAGPVRHSATGEPLSGRIEVSLVGHVQVAADTPYDVEYRGWWPDPLLNFQQSCDVRQGEHVAFWIDVAADKKAAAGEYEGVVAVTADDSPPIELRLGVHVWDFELPDGTHLRNAFTYDEPPVRRVYGDRWNEKMAYRYYDFLLEHRLSIDHLYRREPPDVNLMKYACSKGANAFNVGSVFHRNRGDAADPKLLRYVERLKEAGIHDKAYVYGFDEVKKEKFDEVRQVFGEVHRRFPGLETMTTAADHSFGRTSGLRDVVDIWVPVTDWYDPVEAEQLRREGREMWWYICVVPTHPYANWFVEYPAIEARLLTGAMSYKYKAGGFLYYLITLWPNNRKPITKGPYTDWNAASFVNEEKHYTANGDGSLLCAGPDGPVSTIRLENIRDGFDDYEYLYRLAETVAAVEKKSPAATDYVGRARSLLAVPELVVRTVTDFTYDPDDLGEFRRQVAEAILEGQAILSR